MKKEEIELIEELIKIYIAPTIDFIDTFSEYYRTNAEEKHIDEIKKKLEKL